jgi:putative SOS response-associated peptidase YedK
MCGRYATFGPVSLSREAKEVLGRLELDIVSEIHQRGDHFNIAPTQRALVAFAGERGTWAETMRWGLIPSWAKDEKISTKLINARVETVETKPSFRTAFRKHRCLVPTSGYFEWKGTAGSKQPYFIHDPRGELLMFAGLWDAWKPINEEHHVRTFTIITGEPGKVSGDIHDRQPVIVPPSLWPVWLMGTPDEASATLAAAPEAELVYHPVPKAVGSPRNKGPELVELIALS